MSSVADNELLALVQCQVDELHDALECNEWLKTIYGNEDFLTIVARKHAADFWAVVQQSMFSHLISTIGRLLDTPSNNTNKENISIRRVFENANLNREDRAAFESLYNSAKEVLCRVSSIRDWKIAHNDKKRWDQIDSLNVTVQDIDTALVVIGKAINIIRKSTGEMGLHWDSYRKIDVKSFRNMFAHILDTENA